MAGAWLRLCEAEQGRVLGEPASEAWSEAALAFASVEMPVERDIVSSPVTPPAGCLKSPGGRDTDGT